MAIGSGGVVEVFVPPDGQNGYVLGKTSSDDYAMEWVPPAGAGGGILSIAAGTTNGTGPQVSFANSNGVSFGMNGNTITASANGAAPGSVSAGTTSLALGLLLFSNANGMAFGLNGSTLTASYTVPSVAGLLSAVNVSAGTTSQNLSAFTLSNSNGVSFGLNGSVITASHNGLTSQSNQAYSAGNGSQTFQTFSLADSNGVSFSTGTQGIFATVKTDYLTTARASTDAIGLNTAQSNVTWTVNSSGLSLDARGYAGTGTTFNGTNVSGSMTLNSNGLRLDLSAGAGGGGNFSAGISGGNTAGDTGTVSNRLVLAGGNNVTVSGSTDAGGMTVTISGANVGGAQTGISGVAASNTTYTSGSVTFRDGNGITWGTTTGQQISITHDLQYTSNTSAITSNALNTSVSRVMNVIAATNNTGGGTASLSSNISFSNANGATFYTSAGNAVALSYTVPTQSNQTLGVYGSSQTFGQSSSSTYDARSLTLVGSGNVSVGWSAGSLLVSATQTVQTQASGAIVGSGVTTAGNNVGLSGTLNSAGLSLSATVAAQTNQTGGIYITAQSTGQSSSSTYDMRTLSMVGDGIVSAGWSNGTLRISATQSNQAFSAAGGSSAFQTLGFSDNAHLSFSNSDGSVVAQPIKASLYAVSNTTQSSSGTQNLSALSFAGAGVASVGVTNGTVVVSVPSGGGATPVASASNGSFSFTTLAFSNANNVTFGTSAGSIITASVAAPGAAAENNWFNLLGNNTAGNTTASGSTIGLSGINLTLSGTNGSAINISAPAMSSMVGTNGVSISTNGSTISVMQAVGSYFDNFNGEWPNSTTMQMLQSTSHVQMFSLDMPVSFGFIRIPMSASVAPSSTGVTTGNSQFSFGHSRTHNVVLYSRGVGANSMSLQSIMSSSWTDQQSINVSAAGNSTQFSYTNRATYQVSNGTTSFNMDYSSSAASLNFHTSGMTGLTGLKIMDMGWSTSLQPGQYWLAYGVSSSTASQYTAQGTRLFNIFSNYGMSMPNLAFGTIGAATNSSVGPYPGLGSFTTAGGGTTASIPISAISTSGSHNKMMFAILNIG